MPNNNDTTVIFLRECYEKATRYLKTRAGFIFFRSKIQSRGLVHINLVQNYESIYAIAKGSESGIHALSPANMHNQTHT